MNKKIKKKKKIYIYIYRTKESYGKNHSFAHYMLLQY